MNNKSKTIISILGFVFFMLIIYFLYSNLTKTYTQNNQLESNNIDDNNLEDEIIYAPNITLYDTDNNIIELSDYFGKPIVINFWASTCKYCKLEMPYFEELYQKEKNNVELIMINVTSFMGETKKSAEKYIQENEYTFPILFDFDEESINKYNVYSLPTTLFINSDGSIETGYMGMINKETLEQHINIIKQNDFIKID